jgi:secreted Zn-dependent insulinase-like peptidase
MVPGLELVVYGYSSSLPKILAIVARRMKSFSVSDASERMAVVKGRLIQRLVNWRHNNPAQLALCHVAYLLEPKRWHNAEMLVAMEKVYSF